MSDKDPIVSALMFSAQMTLDLVWALGWCPADSPEPAALRTFQAELETRRKTNPALDICAKEAGL
jgi:hypothetical protein